ncbi:MAG TPA: DUF362 domain-containing protein, partial [Methanomicrobiales archaeon]|nr:DUF362 domain-containing protein [Methanomicrobiales archaeon]
RAKKYRKFTVAKAVMDADVVIGLPKLKTHQLTTDTGAVKLLYGYLPGVTKAEYHLHTAENVDNFAGLLIDLYLSLPPDLFIMDAVVGMEGNGPSGGMPRHIGLLMASPDGPALDFVASSIVGFDPLLLPTVRQAWERGIGPKTLEEIRIAGEDPLAVRISDFKKPDAHPATRVPPELLHVAKWFLAAKPVIQSGACTRCGTCAINCPSEAIRWSEGKIPAIDYRSCIRCFCCQELCPANAVIVKKPLVRRFTR